MKKVSILVPVFNSCHTIQRCVSSLLSQSYENLEIILINDGSSDGSAEVCDSIRDERVKVIHSENEGVSAARNRGLCAATGEYICFCDSDDQYSPEMVARMVARLEGSNCDIAACSFYHTTEKNGELGDWIDYSQKTGNPVLEAPDFLRRMLQDNSIGGFVWNKIFRRKLIGEHRFDTELEICEDLCFTASLLGPDVRVSCIDEPLYRYIFTSGSATQNIRRLFTSDGELKFSIAYKKILQYPISCSHEIQNMLCANIVKESMGKYYRCVKEGFIGDKKHLLSLRSDIHLYFNVFITAKHLTVRNKFQLLVKYLLAEARVCLGRKYNE